MIDAVTPVERIPGGTQIANVTKLTFNLEAVQGFVVVFVSEQYADPLAVVEKPAYEIRADMSSRAGDENRHRRSISHGLVSFYRLSPRSCARAPRRTFSSA